MSCKSPMEKGSEEAWVGKSLICLGAASRVTGTQQMGLRVVSSLSDHNGHQELRSS